ncbi:MAG: TIGR04283 family arsenosugar biosynthesis glycosyltransferase [Burkholderiaceae bacterium]
MTSPTLSIVMPVLDEGTALAARLDALAPLRVRGVELIVVDGGSSDDSWMLARPRVDRLLLAPRGRAAQMNAGAAVARGEVLLFLHADTALPAKADRLVLKAVQPAGQVAAVWGWFDVRIDSTHPMLRVIGAMMNLRSRLSGICTGDQALFVTREAFVRVGGFADQPLMEDIDISRRLKRIGPPRALREPVRTSGRRWEQHGVWRTMLLMWRLRAEYFMGADAAVLAQRYGYRAAPPLWPACVAVMAKAPVPGQAKTRLIPALGAWAAARAQRRFALDTLHLALQAAARMGTQVRWWAAPAASQRFFRALQRWMQQQRLPSIAGAPAAPVTWHDQPSGDLGARMAQAFHVHFSAQPHTPLLLMGTDCPPLSPGHLLQAARALAEHDAVLIPAEDGGYVLIGLGREAPEVFTNVDWSTDRVLAQTRERLRSAGLRWHELPALWDVDTPDDWARLRMSEPATRGGWR